MIRLPNCQAYIYKKYKKAKADVMWPETHYGKIPEEELNRRLGDRRERCGGEVSLILEAVNEADWGSTYAKMEVEWICSRCKHPYIPGRLSFPSNNQIELSDIIKLLVSDENP